MTAVGDKILNNTQTRVPVLSAGEILKTNINVKSEWNADIYLLWKNHIQNSLWKQQNQEERLW